MQPSADNFEAAKLEAILRILLGAETDDELEEAKKQAAALAEMEEDDIGRNEPARFARGNFLTALQFEAPRVPAGHQISGMHGGQWVMAQALAEFYAELFNDLAEAGSPVEDDQVEGATDELEPHGWTLDRDEEDLWEAVPVEDLEEEKGPIRMARGGRVLTYAAKRAPKGGVTIAGKFFQGGRFIPGAVLAQADPETAKKIDDYAQESEKKKQQRDEERRARGPVDPEGLRSRLHDYGEKHGARRTDRNAAKQSLRMILQFHGDLAATRLEELADKAEAAYKKIPDDDAHELLRNRLGKKLAVLHQMSNLLLEGYTGKRTIPERKGSKHENLETTSGGSPEGGVSSGERLGTPGGQALPTMLPGSGEGVGEGVQGLPASEDLGGTGPDGQSDRLGDAPGGGVGTGAGGTVPGSPGGTAPDGGMGDRGGDEIGSEGGGADAYRQSLRQPATPENPTDLAAGNWRYPDRDFFKGGPKAKFNKNVAAIRVLKNIKAEGRTSATPEEQEILSKFLGWGQFPALFNVRDEKIDYATRQRLRDELPPDEYDALFSTDKWQKEREELRSLLSEDEFAAASNSSLNSHYTHPSIVDAHWKMAERLGFQGGRFLETSAGVGYYLGMMPPELASKTHATAVEKDPTTGAILEMLYPSANAKTQPFEEFKSSDNFFDLVASNVPFGDISVFDPKYNKYKANIHDYFFLKSADKVKPGGLIMHITSAGTLDKKDSKIRKELADKGLELVSAIRFPGAAHKENAGTEVVTDMLVLRKKHPGEEPVHPENTPDEAMPEKEGFTGITVDALGRLYHWKDGKRVPGPNWTDTTTVPDPAGGDPIMINQYFADNPDQVLGTLDRTGSMYQGESKNVSRTDDYEARLAAAIERLPQNVLRTKASPKQPELNEILTAGRKTKQGGFEVHDGKLYINNEGVLVEQSVDSKTAQRIAAHLGLRDAMRECIYTQTEGKDATEARAHLKKVYDEFVAKFGPVNDRNNVLCFRTDPDAPRLRSLERWDGKKKKVTGLADIFTRDVAGHFEEKTSADSPADAVAISMRSKGRVDIDHIAKLLNTDAENAGRLLVSHGAAYENPDGGWEMADLYLSGNVRRKLASARAAAEMDPKYKPNVDALMKVQPEDVPHDQISVKLGVGWIAPPDVKQFCADLFGASAEAFTINYNPTTGKWEAKLKNGWEGRQVMTTPEYRQNWLVKGVEDTANFDDILDAALNGKSIKLWIRDGDTKTLDRKGSDDANAKVRELQGKFQNWVWDDDERRERLHRYYNDNFNNIRNVEWDGSHLTLPGKDPAISVYPHIKNFVQQMISTGRGLANHEVGMGKTYAMIASAMEMRRLGLVKKPAIACLKANIEAITNDALKLYPGIKILSTADMFDKDKRRETLSKIATGDYDLIVMTHDHLNKMKMRPETHAKFLKGELAELQEHLNNVKTNAGGKVDKTTEDVEKQIAELESQIAELEATPESKQGQLDQDRAELAKLQAEKEYEGKWSVSPLSEKERKKRDKRQKDLEKKINNAVVQLKKGINDEAKDDTLFFEESGIDHLFVDEAHQFKALPCRTSMENIKGIPTRRSQRATNMKMRCQWLMENNGGRGVAFMTGTPITNTMGEMYNMMRYLQPQEMKERGIENFDAWARQFGEVVTKQEFTIAGQYKPVSRFAKFVNLPELKQLTGGVWDTRRISSTVDANGKPIVIRPRRKDQVVAAPKSETMEALMNDLKERAEAIRKDPETDDNMLVVCTDGRKGALDMRLLDPNAKDDPNSKVNLCINKILEINKQRPGVTQMIFCDLGVNETQKSKRANVVGDEEPEGEEGAESVDQSVADTMGSVAALAGSKTGFKLYEDIIDKLVKGGIPRDKIADFSKLEGAKKEAAMEGMRKGEILVAIGSTQRAGTGVNVQDKLAALHHLDVPWLPASVEQRDGRGWRQGNINDPTKGKEDQQVEIFRYVAEGSLDQAFWQVIANKAGFINQTITNESNAREAREEDTEELTPEQVMAIASGDSRVMERVNLVDEIQAMEREADRHQREQFKLRDLARKAETNHPALQKRADGIRSDMKALEDNPEFSFTIDGQTYTKRAEATEALKKWQEDNKDRINNRYSGPTKVGDYRGMGVYADKGEYYLQGASGEQYDAGATIASFDYQARNLGKRAADVEGALKQEQAFLEKHKAKIGKTYPREQELKDKKTRLEQISKELESAASQAEQEKINKVRSQLVKAIPPGGMTEPEVRDAMKKIKRSLNFKDMQKVMASLEAEGEAHVKEGRMHPGPSPAFLKARMDRLKKLQDRYKTAAQDIYSGIPTEEDQAQDRKDQARNERLKDRYKTAAEDIYSGLPTEEDLKAEQAERQRIAEEAKRNSKPVNISPKVQKTRYGPKYIVSWTPSQELRDAADAGELPSGVTIKEFQGKLQATIWGVSPSHTTRIAQTLQDSGLAQFSRSAQSLRYLKLARMALSYGDAHSARIYRRQAENS